MHIRFLALAGLLLVSPVYAADLAIQLSRPVAQVKDAAALKEKIAVAEAAAKPAKLPVPRVAAASDNEEQDIQRLAERISARLSALRKTREAQPQARRNNKVVAASGRAVAKVDAAPASAAPRAVGHTDRHWHYEGEGGPAQWGRMKPEWAACENGARQSPIDIRDGIRVDLDPVQFDYKPTRFSVLDNGHTVQVNLGIGNTIAVTGRSYELTQFHFHLPSEERINGKSFPMVLHLVHKDAAGRLAMVALLVEEGEPHAVVQQVWNNLPLEKNDAVSAIAAMDLARLLPERREYYTYMGSMTTPPCTEGVLWIVLKEPIRLSSQQIAIFARLYPMNARPIQAQSGRMIKESN